MKKVTLNKPHTHDGVAYAANAQIEVNPSDADWLVQQQIIDQPFPVEKIKAPSSHNNEAHK
ncbi:DUF7210 family protein [Glaciimonas immobilis]|uniref:DUF7210 domain-containing protein n=1 Tax=Glaciimonas immobilis TaxID=728004 RepID=A0A840RP36_9BURK|nr:hypothetical protein [Glaciimonas immobilis]KAF3999063.1 hypothetical protein HAV38_03720 [Glaciimonas immobilis]MBB5198494.1 hypothetical protein [Glaciimonas immobilis]